MKRRMFLQIAAMCLVFCGISTYSQVVDPPTPLWVPIASEGQYVGTSPVVSLPAGTEYEFGLLSGVVCDPQTATAPVSIVVWVSSFSPTCLVNGKPPVDANGKPTGGDPDPGKIKNLYVLQTKADQAGTFVVPPSTTVQNWKVTGYGGGTVTPPTTPVVYTCSQSVTLTFGGTPVTITNTFSAISLSGSPVTSQTAGISCVVQP